MIKKYSKDSRFLYEVYVAERGKDKTLIARRKRGIKSEREAKEIEFAFKSELRNIAKATNTCLWGAWHETFLKRYRTQYRASTISLYDGYLKKYIPTSWAYRPLNSITNEDVVALVERTKEKLGSVSQKNILKMLRRIFELAMEEGHIERNPCRGIVVRARQRPKKVLTAREVDILLKNAKQTKHIYYHLWAFAVKTGMRCSEMHALRWSDVDFDAKLITVSKQWTKKDGTHELKTGDWRVVPISGDLKKLMQELKNANEINSDFVLPRITSWDHGDQAKILKDFCGLLGITMVKFHDLRATFITNMLAQGVALVKVMAIVGHKKMETTDEYMRLAGVEVKGATESLGYMVPESESTENVLQGNFGKK